MIINICKKIIKIIPLNKTSMFSNDIEKQKHILERFSDPEDLIQRSYYQYLCQRKQYYLLVNVFRNIFSIPMLIYHCMAYSSKRRTKSQQKNKHVAVFLPENWSNSYIPKTLTQEFKEIINCSHGKYLIGPHEKGVIKQIITRYWYQPYFCLKCIFKISLYAYQIKEHDVSAIIACSEYSFTSSVLTYYCRDVGIEHINIMHGEKLFDIRDAFVEFDRYYVWDEHYVKLLEELRASKNQFIIAVPEAVKLKVENKKVYKYEMTYYLGGESGKELLNIKNSLIATRLPRERISLRYHPRYSNIKEIKRVFDEYNIEDPNKVSLNTSISNTKWVVALYSTVLYQAYNSGKSIIIDDVTDYKKYMKLKSLRYIMITKPHITLSNITKNS